ncbi:MAG: putative DNA binding domain-containing protein [Verrucomicrobia bacterium]|nr:putative DNA binding domain-containing protein [Verrucomicrobiota bacterium]
MINEYLAQHEGKTLEFKENGRSLANVIKTIISFANTAGGLLIIGVKDKTKEVIGVLHPLQEEERIANAINDSIAPLIVPDIEIHTYRDRELIIIRVPHAAGPFYLKTAGPERGVYIRFGSTNRIADDELLNSLKLFAENRTYDELPSPKGILDEKAIKTSFEIVKKHPTQKHLEALNILTEHFYKQIPTVGGILLFGSNRSRLYPDALIRCARFRGITKEKIIDQQDFSSHLPVVIHEILSFIAKNTFLEGVIGKIHREDLPEYPTFALREAVINAILHADYSVKGCNIQIAIFDDRIEITNPGGLPFGQTIQKALAGFSKLRNRVIGRVFRELNLIEQWGSGLQRILELCKKEGLKPPLIEEHNNQFRLILYGKRTERRQLLEWEQILLGYLEEHKSVSTKTAAKIWNVSDRTARTRLKTLITSGRLQRIATSEKDPFAIFVARK